MLEDEPGIGEARTEHEGQERLEGRMRRRPGELQPGNPETRVHSGEHLTCRVANEPILVVEPADQAGEHGFENLAPGRVRRARARPSRCRAKRARAHEPLCRAAPDAGVRVFECLG